MVFLLWIRTCWSLRGIDPTMFLTVVMSTSFHGENISSLCCLSVMLRHWEYLGRKYSPEILNRDWRLSTPVTVARHRWECCFVGKSNYNHMTLQHNLLNWSLTSQPMPPHSFCWAYFLLLLQMQPTPQEIQQHACACSILVKDIANPSNTHGNRLVHPN